MKPRVQGRQCRTPSGECCPWGQALSSPEPGSQEVPAGHGLQAAPSSVLMEPGGQGCEKHRNTVTQYSAGEVKQENRAWVDQNTSRRAAKQCRIYQCRGISYQACFYIRFPGEVVMGTRWTFSWGRCSFPWTADTKKQSYYKLLTN